jgi:2-oxoglutarate ferredoxin oxidoreductase subunit alpha
MKLAEEKLGEHHLDEKEVVDVVVRFAGDSGDGMQLTGGNFTESTALYGNDLSTFPDFPAEIRAPVGSTFGVSAFQIYFGMEDVTTAGDALDVLVAMNPAALVTNVESGGGRSAYRRQRRLHCQESGQGKISIQSPGRRCVGRL